MNRTASEMKLKQIQSPQNGQDNVTTEAIRQVTGFDMSGGLADEAADRALSTVMRKLDKTLSVQFTVNELISEATDVANLARMFSGMLSLCFHRRAKVTLNDRMENVVLTGQIWDGDGKSRDRSQDAS